MNDFRKPEIASVTSNNEYIQMDETSLVAERERLLLLKKMFDEASDFDSWSKKAQDEAINASKEIFKIQEILNKCRKNEQSNNLPEDKLAAK